MADRPVLSTHVVKSSQGLSFLVIASLIHNGGFSMPYPNLTRRTNAACTWAGPWPLAYQSQEQEDGNDYYLSLQMT